MQGCSTQILTYHQRLHYSPMLVNNLHQRQDIFVICFTYTQHTCTSHQEYWNNHVTRVALLSWDQSLHQIFPPLLNATVPHQKEGHQTKRLILL